MNTDRAERRDRKHKKPKVIQGNKSVFLIQEQQIKRAEKAKSKRLKKVRKNKEVKNEEN